jgi:hypothetical protein
MADLNFPDPNIQTTYSFVGKTWNWDGQRWAFVSSGSGITKLNDLTASVQNFLIGYTGPFPNIVSSGSDHTFNIPIAGTASTGLVSTLAQSFAGAKTFTSTLAEGATPCGQLILVQILKEKVCMNKYHQTQLITQLVNQINLFGSTLDPLPTRLRL